MGILKICFRLTEVSGWNEKNNIEDDTIVNEDLFCETVTDNITNIINAENDYWDSYQASYDKILSVTFDIKEIINDDIISTIKNTLETKMSIDIDKISFETL